MHIDTSSLTYLLTRLYFSVSGLSLFVVLRAGLSPTSAGWSAA